MTGDELYARTVGIRQCPGGPRLELHDRRRLRGRRGLRGAV